MSDKIYFAVRLIPSRPTFPEDMTLEEADIMKKHAVYWKDMAGRGFTLVYGPVLDPKGVYGLGIISVESEEQANSLLADDPAVKPGLVKAEICPMLATLPGSGVIID